MQRITNIIAAFITIVGVSQVQNNDFKYCPKFPKWLSHTAAATLAHRKAKTLEFFQEISYFQNLLGPAFLQMAPSYQYSNHAALLEYLQCIPSVYSAFVEVPHESWYESTEIIQSFATELSQLDLGWLMTDTPGRRDVMHFQFPIPKLMVRFVCQGNNDLDIFRIMQWKELLQQMFSLGLQECYFFLHVHDTSAMLDFAEFVQQELNVTTMGK